MRSLRIPLGVALVLLPLLAGAASAQPFRVDAIASGSPRNCGTPGLPIVYSCRPNSLPNGAPSDDYLTVTIMISNSTGSSVSGNLEICADQSVIDPRRGLKSVTGYFRACSNGAPIVNPMMFPIGSTTLQYRITSKAAQTKLKNRAFALKGFNLPIRVFVDNPASDVNPCVIEGFPSDVGVSLVGIRRSPGQAFDFDPEIELLPPVPGEGDSFNVLTTAEELPRVPFNIVALGALATTTSPEAGFDAIEVRSATITEGQVCPDFTLSGLIASAGTRDGLIEVRPLAPRSGPLSETDFPIAPVLVDPALHPLGLFVLLVLTEAPFVQRPRIWEDTTIVLGHSSRSESYSCEPLPTVNVCARMVIQCP